MRQAFEARIVGRMSGLGNDAGQRAHGAAQMSVPQSDTHESAALSPDAVVFGILLGAVVYVLLRYVLSGFFTVDQNERAVKTSFGRAQRISGTTLDTAIAQKLTPEERDRYAYPQLQVIPPGGPYFRFPWERVRKVSIATETMNMAYDIEFPTANQNGQLLEAITKDHLNTGLTGQVRFRVSEQNLYAYLFGIKRPIIHVMAYFVSILRERIANFSAPLKPGEVDDPSAAKVVGISINDLRKNLRDLNDHMERECGASAARYGISLDASLITSIDPPPDVEAALAAINTAHNHVSSEISLAQASADQRIVQSRRAVEIATLSAQAEVEPLTQLTNQLRELRTHGPGALVAYVRNVRLSLYQKTKRAIVRVAP
jgi:regulator of protease activity HflC (stomatin/prohibitin superfamily)